MVWILFLGALLTLVGLALACLIVSVRSREME